MSEVWQQVKAHEVFNKINNFVSLLVLDCRPAEEFGVVNIRNSHNIHNIDDAEFVKQKLSDIVQAKNPRTNFVEVLLLLPHSSAKSEFLELLLSIITENGGGIVESSRNGSIEQVPEQKFRFSPLILTDAALFFATYNKCGLFLEGSLFPTRNINAAASYANEILSGLYLGDCCNGSELAQHQALGITHIIDASNTRVSKSVAHANGIEHLEIRILDASSAPIEEHFETVHAFIDNARAANGKVLVHCMAGISRSSSLIISYLMKRMGMSLRDAVSLVVTERPVAFPNEGFQQKLIAYEASVREGQQTITTPQEFTELVQSVAKMWSQSNASTSEFDQVPIDTWRQQQQSKMQYLQACDSQENLPPNPTANTEGGNAVAGGGSEHPTDPTKPPKQFLKRGEGKRVGSRSGTRRPARNLNAAPAEKPSLSAYVEKLRTTVASAETGEDVVVLLPSGANSACASADTSMIVDDSPAASATTTSAEAVVDTAAAAVVVAAAEPEPAAVAAVVADGIAV